MKYIVYFYISVFIFPRWLGNFPLKNVVAAFPCPHTMVGLVENQPKPRTQMKTLIKLPPNFTAHFLFPQRLRPFFFFLSQTLENSPRTGRWRRWRSVWDRCSPGPWSRGETRQKAQTNFLQRRADAEALYRSFIRPGAGGGGRGRGGGLESKTSGACSEAGSPRPAWHL